MLARRLLLLFVLALLVPSPGFAQQDRTGVASAEIRVRVSREDGRPPGDRCRVELLTSSGVPVRESSSDDSGNVLFPSVPDGSYRLRLTGSTILDITTEEFTVDHGRSVLETVTVRSKTDPTEANSPESMVAVVDLNVPDAAKKEFDRGWAALQEKNWPEAKRYFQKAAELYPQYASAYNNLGVALMNLGQRSEGKQAFERAVSLNDHFANAHLNLGRVALAEGKYEEAATQLDRAVAANPLNPVGLLLLSSVELQLGKYDECIANARRVHSLPHEGYALAHFFAAQAFEAKHDPSEAMVEYKVFLKESPNSPSASKASAALKVLQSQLIH
jgi:tetratricopeptide (TPR) repeat protein